MRRKGSIIKNKAKKAKRESSLALIDRGIKRVKRFAKRTTVSTAIFLAALGAYDHRYNTDTELNAYPAQQLIEESLETFIENTPRYIDKACDDKSLSWRSEEHTSELQSH